MHTARTRSRRITITDGFNPSTRKMINRWARGGALLRDGGRGGDTGQPS
jgi:hypothetical protein